MALDIIGPANAPNATTIRPADTRSGAFGPVDSWMKDCSSSSANDGTKLQAGFVNSIIAQIRSVIRGNGVTAASTDVVTQDNSDDGMLWKALQHLFQRGQPSYSRDTGTASALVVTLTPQPVEYKEGMVVRVKAAFAPTGASTVTCNGLGPKSIVTGGAQATILNAWSAGDVLELIYDGANFQVIGVVSAIGGITYLSAPKDFYVGGAGASDINDGLAATVGSGHGPYATFQKALNQLAVYNLNGYDVRIHIATGTYVGGTAPTVNGSGTVSLLGPSHATPSAVTITTVGAGTGNCALLLGNGRFFIDGLTFTASGAGNFDCINATGGACSVLLGNVNFGSAGRAHIFAQAGAQSAFDTVNGSTITINAGTSFSYHVYATSEAGVSEANPPGAAGYPNLVIAGAVNFTSFVTAQASAYTNFVYNTITGAGNVASGNKFLASMNGVINVNGSGTNYYPGLSAGSTSTGGQYL